MTNPKKPVVGVFGNLLGQNPGYVTTQGQILCEFLVRDGYEVVSASPKLNRALRLIDIVCTLIRNRQRIEILVVEVYSGLAFILADTASYLAKLFRIPTVLVLHGGKLPEFGEQYPRWIKRVFRRGSVLVSPSAFMADEMMRHGFDVQMIPNVIDLDKYPFKARSNIVPKLLWMRSFHEIYQPQMALDTLAELRRRARPDATLIMAGVDKGLENDMKRSARRMGLSEAVKFPGFLQKGSKARAFSEADIYINTNRVDNMPVSIVEACAMGLPVVATDVGGISRMITHGENGLLVQDNDPVAMADAIIDLLSDEQLTRRVSSNGRLLAERCAWDTVRASWESLFEQVCRVRVPSREATAATHGRDAAEHSI